MLDYRKWNRMKKRGRLVKLALWVIFIFMVAAVMYISFQNGEESKAAGKQLLATFTGIKDSEKLYGEGQRDELMYLLRQSGRVLAFLSIGIVGTLAVHVTCVKWGWFLKTVIAAAVLLPIACFTERMKIYIPSRHYSYEEMLISIAAAMAGLLVVSLPLLLLRMVKGLSNLKTTTGTG